MKPAPDYDIAALRQRIEQFTVGRRPVVEPGYEVECVVVVPPGGDIAIGFERAREVMAEQVPVRLVGIGVTVRENWPEWVDDQSSLVMSEFGAYKTRGCIETSESLRRVVGLWCDDVFAGTVSGLGGADVFYSSTCDRLLQEILNLTPVVEALNALHHRDQIEFIDRGWLGATLLDAVAAKEVPKVSLRTWRAKLAVYALGGIIVSSAWQVGEYLWSRSARKMLAAQPMADRDPDLWVGLIGDSAHFNRAIVTMLAEPALDAGRRVGVLVIGRLRRGSRSNDSGRRTKGKTVLSGLGRLHGRLGDLVVEQAVIPSSAIDFAWAWGRGLRSSLRAVVRMLRKGPRLAAGVPAERLPPLDPWALAKLLTWDVLYAVLAAAAANTVCERKRLSGVPIVISTSGYAPFAAVEQTFRHAGALTADYIHGLSNDKWHGKEESRTEMRFVWTQWDAQVLAPLGQRLMVVGPPLTSETHPPRRDLVANVLILTNYYHWSSGPKKVDFPASLQSQLLCLPKLVRQRAPRLGLNFRWRPHPLENSKLIESEYHNLHDIELSRSRERSLDIDLAWSDVVVSSMSSAVIEAIFAGLPTFVHVIPGITSTTYIDFIAEQRHYFYAPDVIDRLIACVEGLRAGDPDVLNPEREARMALAGSSGMPTPFLFAVDQWVHGDTEDSKGRVITC